MIIVFIYIPGTPSIKQTTDCQQEQAATGALWCEIGLSTEGIRNRKTRYGFTGANHKGRRSTDKVVKFIVRPVARKNFGGRGGATGSEAGENFEKF